MQHYFSNYYYNNVFQTTMKTTLLATILLLSIAVSEVIGVPVAENCAAKYQASLNETLRLKRTCEEAGLRDCCQLKEAAKLFNIYSPESGVYDISNVCGGMTLPFTVLPSLPAMQARCDMKNDDGGWLVLVRRTPDVDERIDFDRTWDDYEKGFGDLNTEFWYGLKNMHCLTNRESVELRIDLKKRDGTGSVLKYAHFVVDGPDTQYTLHVGEPQQTGYDYFGYHDGIKFTTKDNDNDNYGNNCAVELYPGGWWFDSCYRAHLTEAGAYNAPRLYQEPSNAFIDYDYAEMSIRSKSCTQDKTTTCT